MKMYDCLIWLCRLMKIIVSAGIYHIYSGIKSYFILQGQCSFALPEQHKVYDIKYTAIPSHNIHFNHCTAIASSNLFGVSSAKLCFAFCIFAG